MKDWRGNSNNTVLDGSAILLTEEYNQSVTPPSTAVIEAIASVEDVDSIELSSAEGITLHDHVDTDTPDRVLTAGGANVVSITFLRTEYRVWIESDEITLVDRETDSTAPPDPEQ